MEGTVYKDGLEGVAAARTALSYVDGQKGELLIAGFPVDELAQRASFEEVTYLLWHGNLPTSQSLAELRDMLAERRSLPLATMALLRTAAEHAVAPMDALRMASGTLDLDSHNEPEQQRIDIAARFPTIVSAYARLRMGLEPVTPDPALNQAANMLYMLDGKKPTDAQARALETYLNTVVDHGLNASTFTARVIVSTGSDLVSAIEGAVGALKGPLHGGAPGPALDMVFEIGSRENAEAYLRAKLGRGERLMGFGHRIYKVRDPRAEVLSAAAGRLYEQNEQIAGDQSLYELARFVEEQAVRLLARFKPGRKLQTNVEFYTALLLHGLGLSSDLFTPTFAVGRVPGWIAHCLEQKRYGRLIRPSSEYTGERNRRWIPLAERK
ncbi:MAG TPA: citrate synthase/methylcitrate synthase [Candidatus Binatia bacterium]|nr:citrate synthase/methylcitrate synthase [Candidatus Binatia bacterium]